MGMFDWVTWRGREDWQTKDFECTLDRVLILDDGRAIRQRDAGDSKPFPPGEPHGWIYVYTSFHEDPNDKDFSKHWVEYRLKFTDGKLVAAVPQSERAQRLDAERLLATKGYRYHANGTYWSGVPTINMPCDFCRMGIMAHDPRTHACPVDAQQIADAGKE